MNFFFLSLLVALGLAGSVSTTFNDFTELANENKSFACDIKKTKSLHKPTSVHRLRPGDIEIVGVLGDSGSSAYGAKATMLYDMVQDERGVSWSSGGEYPDLKVLLTLPNILRKYNPDLYGFSSGPGSAESPAAGFNLAEKGVSSLKIKEQATKLVDRIKMFAYDFESSWKMITLHVGSVDLCRFCHQPSVYSVENYINNVKETLDYLQANLPRTLVNLLLNMDLSSILTMDDPTCLEPQFCVVNISSLAEAQNRTQFMNQGLIDLINSGQYDKEDNFTVVIQPFMEDYTPILDVDGVTADYSFYAPDCLHFSIKGQAAMASELWGNMISPVGKKSSKWTVYNKNISCPTFPYIYTNVNSKIVCVDMVLSTYCYTGSFFNVFSIIPK